MGSIAMSGNRPSSFILWIMAAGLGLPIAQVLGVESTDQHLLVGNRKLIPNGYAQSFVGVDPSTRTPIALGVMLSNLENPGGNENLRLDLPKSIGVSPYDHVEISWGPLALEIRFLFEAKSLSQLSGCTAPENLNLILCHEKPEAVFLRIPYASSPETREIRLPSDLKMRGYFPQNYSISYDPGLKQFRVSLEDLRYTE